MTAMLRALCNSRWMSTSSRVDICVAGAAA
jgi:hypothetical protein